MRAHNGRRTSRHQSGTRPSSDSRQSVYIQHRRKFSFAVDRNSTRLGPYPRVTFSPKYSHCLFLLGPSLIALQNGSLQIGQRLLLQMSPDRLLNCSTTTSVYLSVYCSVSVCVSSHLSLVSAASLSLCCLSLCLSPHPFFPLIVSTFLAHTLNLRSAVTAT